MSEDPLSFAAGDTNLYRYALNQPLFTLTRPVSLWDKIKSFGKGLVNGFWYTVHDVALVPVDFFGTIGDSIWCFGYEPKSYLARGFEELLRRGDDATYWEAYESLILNTIFLGIPNLWFSIEDARHGDWEPLGENIRGYVPWLVLFGLARFGPRLRMGTVGEACRAADDSVLAGGKVLPRPAPTGTDGNGGFSGHRGFELSNHPLQPVRNSPTSIGQRQFSGHALDQMQNRGIPPSVVENTIQHGIPFPGKRPGTQRFYDPVNNVSVIIDSENGTVVTVRSGRGG